MNNSEQINRVMDQPSSERSEYHAPEILVELELETRAGSPLFFDQPPWVLPLD